LSSRPKRTRISYFALLATTTHAVFLKENRMMFINATNLDRKSGGSVVEGSAVRLARTQKSPVM
jgi:kynurenine formamidase